MAAIQGPLQGVVKTGNTIAEVSNKQPTSVKKICYTHTKSLQDELDYLRKQVEIMKTNQPDPILDVNGALDTFRWEQQQQFRESIAALQPDLKVASLVDDVLLLMQDCNLLIEEKTNRVIPEDNGISLAAASQGQRKYVGKIRDTLIKHGREDGSKPLDAPHRLVEHEPHVTKNEKSSRAKVTITRPRTRAHPTEGTNMATSPTRRTMRKIASHF